MDEEVNQDKNGEADGMNLEVDSKSFWTQSDVFRSKMSDEDELLLLSAAASAATIALTACIVKRRKRAELFWMHPLF